MRVLTRITGIEKFIGFEQYSGSAGNVGEDLQSIHKNGGARHIAGEKPNHRKSPTRGLD